MPVRVNSHSNDDDAESSGHLGWSAGPGGRKHRPGLGRVAERREAGEVDYFVVYRLDRAFRNRLEQLQFRAAFFGKDSRCKLVSLRESLDLGTKTGRLSADFLSVIAEYQRAQLQDIIRDGLASRRQDGYPTGEIGYGWRRTPKVAGGRPGLEPDPERGPWVREIYDLYLSGWGTRNIAREMECRGAPAPTRSGHWKGTNVRTILRDPLHAGLLRDGDAIRPGVHWEQRLVEPQEYERVLSLMVQRRRVPTHKAEKELQPLYRVARCGTSGEPVTVVEDDTGPGYRCRGSADRGDVLPLPPGDPALVPGGESHGGDAEGVHPASDPDGGEAHGEELPWKRCWCGGWHKSSALVNRELLRLLSQAVTVPAFLQLAEDEARALLLREGREALAAQRGQTVRAIRELQLKRERLTRGYVAGVIAEVDFRKLGSEISADLERNEAELGELERRLANQQGEAALLTLIREKLPRLPEIWEVLLPEERRQLIRDLTEFVVIERQSTGHALLRVKVPFLPELQAWLGHGKSRAAGFAGGVAGLTPRELAYLCLLSEGQTPPQIRARWTSNTGHIYNLKKSLLRRLGVESLEEAIDLARERFLAERERLPLDASSSNSRGVWHPTERQRIQQVLEGYGRGLDREAICAELGLRPHTVRVMEWRARKLCGVKTLEEVLEGFSNGAPLPEG